MMIKKKQFGWVLIMALITACSSTPKQAMQKEVSTIDLTEIEFSSTPQPLSDFVESIEYIKLSEEPLVTDAKKVNVAEDKNGNLYLDVPGGLLKYAPDGTFIKNLVKIGKGPGEIAMKLGTIFNMDRDFMLISAYGVDYPKINLNGEWLGRVKRTYVPERWVYSYWKDYEIYKHTVIGDEKDDEINRDGEYFFHVKDIRTDSTIYQMKNPYAHIKGKRGGPRLAKMGYPAYRGPLNESTYWFKPLFIDTVYCTTDWTDVRPLYVIKQHSSAADYEWNIKEDASVRNFSQNELLNTRRLGAVWALENGILYFYYLEIKEGKLGFGFCPANGKGKYISLLFKNDIDEYCPPLDFSSIMDDCSLFYKNGYIYIPVNAFKFFEEGAKPPFPDLTEDSNPVIVKLKLKKKQPSK